MENKLSRLFDYQKYAPNSELDAIIKSVESKYQLDKVEQLSDDELFFVAAAGVPEEMNGKKPHADNEEI